MPIQRFQELLNLQSLLFKLLPVGLSLSIHVYKSVGCSGRRKKKENVCSFKDAGGSYQDIKEWNSKAFVDLLESESGFHTGMQMSDQISRCVGLFAAKIIVLPYEGLHTIIDKSGSGTVIHKIALLNSVQLEKGSTTTLGKKKKKKIPIHRFPSSHTITYQDQNRHADRDLGQGFDCIIKRPRLGTVVDQYDSICVTIHVDCRGIERESSMRSQLHRLYFRGRGG